MTRPATFAQRATYDAFMDVARTMQAGREPTAAQLEQVADSLVLLKLEPQPAGFVEGLESLLAVVNR